MPRPSVVLLAVLTVLLTVPGTARAQAPSNTAPPGIDGVAREGSTLTAAHGTWTGSGTITFTRRWQRCDPSGLECVNLAATGTTYVPVAADVNSTLRVVVTASNAYGPASATSPATSVVTGTPPQNTVAPAVTGHPRSGQTLTAQIGSWTGTSPITYAHQWRRCDASGSNCAPIDGATAPTYGLTPADMDATIRVRITAANPSGTGEATSPSTPLIGAAAPPVNTGVPAITGTPRDAQTLSSTTGTWTGAATMTYARRWQRCNSLGMSCLDTSTTTATYTLTGADINSTLRVIVTATNPDGTVAATSSTTAVVEPAPPANTRLAVISGPMRVTHTLSAGGATWTGTAPIAFAHQWQRCDSAGAGCAAIPNATAATYVLGDDDLGRTLRYVQTGSNAGGSATATSAATPVVGPLQPPVNTARPETSGTTRDGSTLTSSTGTWSGVATIAYARRWQRCDADGSGCTDTTATGTNYVLSSADVGRTVRIVVTASNADGSARQAGLVSAVIAPLAPAATGTPSITGLARDDSVLSAGAGTWSGTAPLTMAYQWRRCESAGGGCVDIEGATASSLRLTATDIGRTIRVAVTASNAAGATTATSNPTQPVAIAPPTNTRPPSVTGTPRDGTPAVLDLGTWNGTQPMTLTHQWIRCNSGGSACTDIPGAGNATYAPVPGDIGGTLRVRITASNSGGTASALSAPSAAVAPAPPAGTTAPVLSGVAQDGVLLSAGPGTWTGSAPLTMSYRWERCDALLECRPIAGAAQSTYRLTSADVGARIRAVATASNGAGSAEQTTEATPEVAPAPPASAALPVITGTARDTQTISADTGLWTGTTPMTRNVQWLRCDADGQACSPIPGATATHYVLVADDVATRLRLRVTASNAAGQATVQSLPSDVVSADPPVLLRAAAIIGLARDGRTLTAEDGEWSGTAPLEIAYRWQRCNSAGSQCKDITGAAGKQYTLVTEDMGATLRVVVSATNRAATASTTSAPTGVVQPNPPVNVVAPAITGETRDGELLRAQDGSWTGVILIGFEYRWWRCNATGGDCGVIPGATASTYRLAPDDVGVRIKVEVIGRNGGGATSAFSEPAGMTVHAPPIAQSPPSVQGRHGVGQLLEAQRGAWTGSPTMVFEHTWLRCDAQGGDCETVDVGDTDALTLTAAEIGRTIRVRIRAVNPAGAAIATSDPSPVVRDDPPVLLEPPAARGALVAHDQALEATEGRWSGGEPMRPSYQWRRCNVDGLACVAIVGATGASYTPQAADVGSTLRVAVTMDNGVGATTSVSAPTVPVAVQPPRSTAAPLIAASGNRPGKEVSAATGTWVGAAPVTHSYAWQRCDPEGESCVPIADATNSKYTLTVADIGRTLRVAVTGHNVSGRSTARSAAFGPVGAEPPATTVRPTITLDGKPREGTVLRVSAGTWTGSEPLSLVYQWQRCVGTGDCREIPGATGTEYQPGEIDIGRRIRVRVTGSNAAGTTVADSQPTEAVLGRVPVVRERPDIAVKGGGPPVDGRDLVLGPGSWDGTGPFEISYRWQRCSRGTCTDITGEVGPTYRLTAKDVGSRLVGIVTARGAAGRADAPSAQTDLVLADAPRAELAPRIIRPPGLLEAGSRLGIRAARFSGTDPLTVTTQWLRCAPSGDKCRAIKDATGDTYTLTESDVARRGKTRGPIAVAMVARNSAGAVTSTSPPLFGAIGLTARFGFRGRPVISQAGVVVGLACKGGRPQPCTGVLHAVIGKRKGRVRVTVPAGQRSRATVVVPGARRRPGTVRLRFRPLDGTAGKAVARSMKLGVAKSTPEAPPPAP